MATITADEVKELRERTGAGFMDCKNALVEADGDVDKAIALLRERGLAAAAKKAGREAREGAISSYIHTGGRVGVLIEVNCETDFVARTDEFQKLVRDLAVQVAGMAPRYVDVDRIPEADLEAKKAELAQVGDRPEQARGHPPEDRRGPAQEVVRRGQPLRSAVPRRGPNGSRPHHRGDRHDRREHPRPPLRPLRARGGAVSEAPTTATTETIGAKASATSGSCSSCPARRSSATGRTASILRSVAFIARQVGEVHRLGVQVGIVVGGGNIFRGLAAAARAWTARPATTSACSPRS